MADKVTTTYTLAIGIEYIDSSTEKAKTVYLKIPNPRSGLTENTIKNTMAQLLPSNPTSVQPILLRPDNGQPFNGTSDVKTAYTESQEVIEVDIGIE